MNGWTIGIDAWLFMAAWALVLFGVVWLLVREPRRSGYDEPLESLRARLARGEISTDEFEKARRLIESDALS